MQTHPGWGAWCAEPAAPTRPTGSPSPALPVPFEVTLGVIYRQEGGVEWSGTSLPFSGFTSRALSVFHRSHGARITAFGKVGKGSLKDSPGRLAVFLLGTWLDFKILSRTI